MFIIDRVYSCPKWYDLYLTCHTHGWINLAPYSWDEQKNRLEFALLFGGYAVDVSIQQHNWAITACVASEKRIGSKSIAKLDAVLSRILGLEQETTGLMKTASKISEPYQQLIKKGAGRLLRGASLWEDAAKTLFTTNCSWALTQKICINVCSANFASPSPRGRFPFPHPSSLMIENIAGLRKKIPIGYRAEYLKLLAQTFNDDPKLADLERKKHSYEEAYKIVSKLKGFGPYARTHLLIIAGYYERIPIDSEVVSYIKKNHNCRRVDSFIDRHYGSWGRYKWWGLKLERMLQRRNWLGD